MTPKPCVVDRPMNDHGAVTLSEEGGTRSYAVVAYASSAVRETLATAGRGSTVRVQLEPLSSRGDAWKAIEAESDHGAKPDLEAVT